MLGAVIHKLEAATEFLTWLLFLCGEPLGLIIGNHSRRQGMGRGQSWKESHQTMATDTRKPNSIEKGNPRGEKMRWGASLSLSI